VLEAVVKYVIKELGVITQAPMSFILALAVISIGVWYAIGWRYAGTIDSLDGRNKLQADQIADYKNKLSGASPDEAKRRIDALEEQVRALSPRRLTAEQKNKLRLALSSKNHLIEISDDMADADARGYKGDIAFVFQSAGWQLRLPMVMGVGNPPPTGLGLRVSNKAFLNPAEALVKQAFEGAQISFDLQEDPFPPRAMPLDNNPIGLDSLEPEVRLLITTKLF
jgi:hypothetical protein